MGANDYSAVDHSAIPCVNCGGTDPRPTQRMFSNGTIHHVIQCGTFGRQLRGVKRGHFGDELPPFDETLEQKFMDEWLARRAEFKEENDSAWWRTYEAHINSLKWAEIRAKRLAWDKHTCQGCGDRATEVHHMTYARLGDELLLDLVSVCRSCHKKIHGR
jgi:5-methylcytosine-specific restriction endonuclease McrA